MEKFFKLRQHGTNVPTELMAGATTFFTMAYIIFVNPSILSITGMPSQAVFLATIISAVVGTLIMGLFANVPYAQAPGMGLNAFFTYTVCFSLGYSWQQALALVFICGLINILITVTKVRKSLIKSIPDGLQNAIGGGIGIFIAYIGVKNAGLIQFLSDNTNITSVNGEAFAADSTYSGIYSLTTSGGIVPELVKLNSPGVLLAVIGIILTVILLIINFKGAILASIFVCTILAIPMGLVDLSSVSVNFSSLGAAFSDLGITFGAAFSSDGIQSLLSDTSRIPLLIVTIFAFSLTDTFDTIGTFIGTGKRSGIFSDDDMKVLENNKTGMKSKMERALFADAVATSIGAIFGTSNVTTYVESAAGIGAGGRTGLTSCMTAFLFLCCTVLAPVAGVVPAQATAPALIVVGVMMMSSFKNINWQELEEAIPAFFAGVFMALCYSISYGIAAGFVFYCIVKLFKGKAKEIHPFLLIATVLFIINFIAQAII